MQKSLKSGKIFLVKTSPENLALKRAFNKSLSERTKKVRETSGRSAREVADHLRVKLDTYYRYEKKVAMPLYLIPRFLKFTDGNSSYMMGFSDNPRRAKLTPIK